MPRVLILYTDGLRAFNQFNAAVDYTKMVKGPLELLGHVGRDETVRCYVNEQAMLRSLPCNPWSLLLRALGFDVRGTLQGNAILCCAVDEKGYDLDVSVPVVGQVERYEEERMTISKDLFTVACIR